MLLPKGRNRPFLAVLIAVCLGFPLVARAEPPCPAAVASRLELPATAAALSQHRPLSIVALGSSSTEGAGASAPERTYPARLQALLRAALPDAAVTVLNRGVGGQTIDAVMDRIEADVLALRPTLVIWQIGTNEVLRAIDPAYFAARLDLGVRRIRAGGADLVLMDSQVAPRVDAGKKAVFDYLMAREAREREVSLFSRGGLMRAWIAGDSEGDPMIGLDGLHHTDRGYGCLAEALGASILDAVARGGPGDVRGDVPLASVRKP